MFDVPSDDTITKVIISEKCARGEEEPKIVRGEKKAVALKKNESVPRKRSNAS